MVGHSNLNPFPRLCTYGPLYLPLLNYSKKIVVVPMEVIVSGYTESKLTVVGWL